MILYNDKSFVTNSEYPDTDWLGNADYVVPDGSELAEKIKALYPHFDFVTDENGLLIDVEEIPHEEPEPAETTPTNAELAQQITDVQMALCEIYESLS